MSADNRICIMQDQHGEWAVWHGSASAEYYEPPHDAVRFPTETRAWDYARGYEAGTGYVEYGIQYISKTEQECALKDTIDRLKTALEILNGTAVTVGEGGTGTPNTP